MSQSKASDRHQAESAAAIPRLRVVASKGPLPDPDRYPSLREEALDELFAVGGDQLVIQLVELFNQALPERVSAIQAGAQPDRADAAQRAAHTLKSAASNLGAMRMWAIAQRLETLAGAREFGPVYLATLDRLLDEYSAVEPHLRRRLRDVS